MSTPQDNINFVGCVTAMQEFDSSSKLKFAITHQFNQFTTIHNQPTFNQLKTCSTVKSSVKNSGTGRASLPINSTGS